MVEIANKWFRDDGSQDDEIVYIPTGHTLAAISYYNLCLRRNWLLDELEAIDRAIEKLE